MISIGATVGNYLVQKQIGQGAMGTVYLAVQPMIGKRVALKVINPTHAKNENSVGRFFNEARAASQIGHQNIVEVFDFGKTADGDSFLVMELLEGDSLGVLLKRERLSVPRALHIAMQIADGLAAAHEKGITHRDLKPDNVILTEWGGAQDFVKVVDFGLAKLTDGTAAHKTKTGAVLGTAHYMAPEQAQSSKHAGPPADIYSLGCVLYQMLTGKLPFPGEAFGDVLVKHMRDPAPVPSQANSQVPRPIDLIVAKALAKRPEDRFASMDDVKNALRDPGRFAQQLGAWRDPSAAGLAIADTLLAEPGAITLVEEDRGFDRPKTSPTIRNAQRKLKVKPNGGSNRAQRWFLSVLLVLAVIAGGVCVYFITQQPLVTVSVTTDPPGAMIYEGALMRGLSPANLKVPYSRDGVLMTFEKSGYETRQLKVTLSGDQQLNIALTPMTAPASPDLGLVAPTKTLSDLGVTTPPAPDLSAPAPDLSAPMITPPKQHTPLYNIVHPH